MITIKKYIIAILVMLIPALQCTFAACSILTSSGKPAKGMEDGISILLAANCPKDVFELRKEIKANNLLIKTTMVANRGYHNPSQGSFSFFEMVSGRLDSLTIQDGDFFFGHFTTVDDNDELVADQGPTSELRLMIEAFAWDPKKKLFNFYELIGDGSNNQWFYRGDSGDIFADNVLLHRQQDPSHPQFGNRLRCSGCHGAGGPIMKEIYSPHNDWLEPKRQLDFGGRVLSKPILDLVENLVSPDQLSESVILGIKKLETSRGETSPQETLRPLFCPVEVNFMSDRWPNEEQSPLIEIPIGFFINKKLAGKQIESILILRFAYEKALQVSASHFPETSLSDADHAWLTPVKAESDQLAIDHLIKERIIDEKFAFDVLSIDMTNPIFSEARCGLLKYIPNTWSNHWQEEFKQNLKSANNVAALELLNQLNNAAHTPEYHKLNALRFLQNCIEKLQSDERVNDLFSLLVQRRAEIKASEISKNRRGQILEPGFRVIFPETNLNPVAGKLMLTGGCEVR